MREGVSNPSASGRNPRIAWSGVVLVAIGLSILAVMAEWFAAFDACVANPACHPGVPASTLESYLALMVVGIALTVVGAVVGVIGARGQLRRAMIIWV